jgi:hypothetical protein
VDDGSAIVTSDLDFNWMGDWVNFSRLVRYYRNRIREASSARDLSLFRDRLRLAIAERRRQLVEQAMGIAA